MLRSTFITSLLALASFATSAHAAEPKKLLVVTVTGGYRHSSIETAEKVLAEIGSKSGVFTVDFVHQPEGQPKKPGNFAELKPKESEADYVIRKGDYTKELEQFHNAEQGWGAKFKAYMADKMALDKLKGYDGFVFANTTGDLQLPDRDGFINLIKEGKAFIAMHAGADTYDHGIFPAYVEMLGGEFQAHKAQVSVEAIVHDTANPITKMIPQGWKVYDEIYRFINYDRSKVTPLLGLDVDPNEKTPTGYFPISWCKDFGKGRVYYTSFGHREDVWDPTWKADSPKDRQNSPEVATAYQAMILAGIKWALHVE